jgi:hypothetical protein
MDDITADPSDPRAEIERLEARIEALADKIEGCRKLMLAARIAIALGTVLLGASILGLIAFDATLMLAAIAGVLGGFVLLGSNKTTAREAAGERAEAEVARAALIGAMDLPVVPGRPTLH